jgi:putative membrane protein insertion efficiency factor
MAKHISIFLLRTYQGILSPLLSQVVGVKNHCRFNPSCSEYMLQMIIKHGVVKGISLGLVQLSNCHPFGKSYATV